METKRFEYFAKIFDRIVKTGTRFRSNIRLCNLPFALWTLPWQNAFFTQASRALWCSKKLSHVSFDRLLFFNYFRTLLSDRNVKSIASRRSFNSTVNDSFNCEIFTRTERVLNYRITLPEYFGVRRDLRVKTCSTWPGFFLRPSRSTGKIHFVFFQI